MDMQSTTNSLAKCPVWLVKCCCSVQWNGKKIVPAWNCWQQGLWVIFSNQVMTSTSRVPVIFYICNHCTVAWSSFSNVVRTKQATSRYCIGLWETDELLPQQMYFLLLHSLMFTVDHVPETAAYLETPSSKPNTYMFQMWKRYLIVVSSN